MRTVTFTHHQKPLLVVNTDNMGDDIVLLDLLTAALAEVNVAMCITTAFKQRS